ncbi:MAG TPA: ABC transporter ATP-binding protein [Anaerolineae bacterium]|jgi:bacitracin transport system ATP-binding protein|nr:ABC transporter ATP-binding protein [Anaerolineae bacterium]
MGYILRTHQLTKRYKQHVAVDGIDMTLKAGEIYGFLGQNGAGKTTTLRMIMGLIKPSAGHIELFGEKITGGRHRIFERTGSIIEFPGFYPDLTGVENLDIHRRLMGMGNNDCIEEALETVGLLDVKNRKVKNYSLGIKQRLGIARALLHHPELLILDEPTNGLDPVGIKEVRQLILDLAQLRRITVLISNHILSEVQLLATKIGIIHQGSLLEEVDYDLLQKRNRHYIEIKVNNDRKAALLLEQKLHIMDYLIPEPGTVRIYEQLTESAQINRFLVQNDIDVGHIALMRDSLEDYFINLTGGALNV